MDAKMWISHDKCRVIVTDDNGQVVTMEDYWNNRASAQLWLRDEYPGAREIMIRDSKQVAEMDAEWDRCKLGIG